MTSIVCARCGTPSTSRRRGTPWCGQCGIWLFRDEVTNEWISCAEYAHREPAYRRRQAVAATQQAAVTAQRSVALLLPAGWHTQIAEPVGGGCYTLSLYPPTAAADRYAYLIPPIGGYDWRVRVCDPVARVCRTLFIPGTAEPATFGDAVDAARAGLSAVDMPAAGLDVNAPLQGNEGTSS